MGYLGSGYCSVEPLRLNLLTVEGSMLEGIPLESNREIEGE